MVWNMIQIAANSSALIAAPPSIRIQNDSGYAIDDLTHIAAMCR